MAAVARKQQFESEIADGQLRARAPIAAAGALNRAAMEAGVVLTEIYPERTSLEETFFPCPRGSATRQPPTAADGSSAGGTPRSQRCIRSAIVDEP